MKKTRAIVEEWRIGDPGPLFLILLTIFLLTGCLVYTADSVQEVASYHQIDQEMAKQMMTRDDGHVIVDVRRQDEYDAGHISGAILIPNESIEAERPKELPDLDQIILKEREQVQAGSAKACGHGIYQHLRIRWNQHLVRRDCDMRNYYGNTGEYENNLSCRRMLLGNAEVLRSV